MERLAIEKYWYRQFVGECPVCGRDASYRERIYGEKPKEKEEIYKCIPDNQTYCGCLGY